MTERKTDLIQDGKDITAHLTDAERMTLSQCEQIIEKGLNTFFEVGKALSHIKYNRLHRETHKTFEKYCKDRWDIGKSRAYQQIGAYEAVALIEMKMSTIVDKKDLDDTENTEEKCTDCKHRKALANKNKGVKIPNEYGKCIRPEGLCEKHTDHELSEKFVHPNHQEIILPINEAQTRPLTKLSPDDQVKAWGLVLTWLNEGKKLTAGLVSKAAAITKGETIKKTVKKAKQVVDKTTLVSPIFRKQYQVMLDIISAERNTNYATSSPKEMVNWLEQAIEIIKMDN